MTTMKEKEGRRTEKRGGTMVRRRKLKEGKGGEKERTPPKPTSKKEREAKRSHRFAQGKEGKALKKRRKKDVPQSHVT